MQYKSLNTAVLFLVYNRPDCTRQVFEAIRQAKPPRLYVAADGPREGKLGEVERIEEVRTIATAVDWPCKVKKLFRSKNLGCAKSVIGGINWFFKNETRGIILEDDVLPSKAFFYYIEKNLNIYEKKGKVWAISGTNIISDSKKNLAPCFSLHGTVWGWGTWKDRWKKFKKKIPNYKKLKNYPTSLIEKINFLLIIENVKKDKKYNTHKYWDYWWLINRIENTGLTLMPKNNYARNIGFFSGNSFAHNTKAPFKYSKICNKLEKILELKITRNLVYDKHLWNFKTTFLINFKIALYFIIIKIMNIFKNRK